MVCVQCGGGHWPAHRAADDPRAGPTDSRPDADPDRRRRRRRSSSAPATSAGAARREWRLTGRLLDGIGGTVFAAGDNAYISGTAQQFRDCYEPLGPAQGPDSPGARQSRIRIAGRGALFRLLRRECRTAGPGLLQLHAGQLARDRAQQQHRRHRRVARKVNGCASTWPSNPTEVHASRTGTIRCSARGRTETTPGCATSGASCTTPASTSSWSATITCTSGSPRRTRTAVRSRARHPPVHRRHRRRESVQLRHGPREQRKAHQRVRRPQAHVGGRSLRLGVHPGPAK